MKSRARGITILAFVLALCGGAQGQKNQKSIMDYYLDLPDELFYCEIMPKNLTRDFKKKQIRRANVTNGFILASSEGHPLQVALFTDARLGVTVVAVNRPCGPGCMCSLFGLYRPDGDGKWRDFEGFPSDGEIEKATGTTDPCEFALPEVGTDIKVINSLTGKTLLLIGWDGGKFFIKKR